MQCTFALNAEKQAAANPWQRTAQDQDAEKRDRGSARPGRVVGPLLHAITHRAGILVHEARHEERPRAKRGMRRGRATRARQAAEPVSEPAETRCAKRPKGRATNPKAASGRNRKGKPQPAAPNPQRKRRRPKTPNQAHRSTHQARDRAQARRDIPQMGKPPSPNRGRRQRRHAPGRPTAQRRQRAQAAAILGTPAPLGPQRAQTNQRHQRNPPRPRDRRRTQRPPPATPGAGRRPASAGRQRRRPGPPA